MSVAPNSVGFRGQSFTPTISDGPGPAGATGAITLVVLAVSSVFFFQGDDNQRILLSACAGLILFALTSFSPAAGMATTIAYLAFLGGIRRWLIPLLGYQNYDPLLMVVPGVVSLFFANRLVQRQIPRDTLLSKLLLALLVVMGLEILNPLQGGIIVGFAGALFYIIPLFWYYLGRSIATPKIFRALFGAVVLVAIAGMLYGLYQTWFGFSPLEKRWLVITGNDAALGVGVGRTQRVFSIFSSFQEYCTFLECAAVICFVNAFKNKNRISAFLFVAFLITLFLSSSRGAFVGVLFACTSIWSIQGAKPRTWIPRLVVAGIVGALSIILGLSQVSTQSLDDKAGSLVKHQIGGLTNPLDSKKSTGGLHASLVLSGIMGGIRNPLGAGLGATTIAARKFATDQDAVAGGTEVDYSNLFISLGVFGGLLYLTIIIFVLRSALRRWHTSRSPMYLCMVGLLVMLMGQWLNGALYSIIPITWLCIGAFDRADAADRLRTLQEKAKLIRENANAENRRFPGKYVPDSRQNIINSEA